MSKYCVFCGKKPLRKTKEHVIPYWLIELTGKPSRKVNLGMIKTLDHKAFTQRQHSFNSFTFPACYECNQYYSSLEDSVKKIIENILKDKSITSNEISLLLDWFDKVRVGLWLGYHQLDRNITNINPTFHISTRIGQYDRTLFICKSDALTQKLNICGADTLCFQFIPSAFLLIINNYYFTNISFNYLFSRRIGFPYPKTSQALPNTVLDSQIGCDFSTGFKRINTPFIRFPVGLKCIEIYQPMFKNKLVDGPIHDFYGDYVKANSLNFDTGEGAIFKVEEKNITKYLNRENINLSPKVIYQDKEIYVKSGINVLKWQVFLTKLQPDTNGLTKEQRSYQKEAFKAVIKINRYLIKQQESLLKKIQTST